MYRRYSEVALADDSQRPISRFYGDVAVGDGSAEAEAEADAEAGAEGEAPTEAEAEDEADGSAEGEADREGRGTGVGSGMKREGTPRTESTRMSTKKPMTRKIHGRASRSSRVGRAPR